MQVTLRLQSVGVQNNQSTGTDMNVQINPFILDGCHSNAKFDPSELQELLHEQLQKKATKNGKRFAKREGDIVINGAFTEVDEGNYLLHLTLAFLGKARLVCHLNVLCDGKSVLYEEIALSPLTAAFTPPKSQLKYYVKVLAGQII